jgi:hypothetical protein
MANGHTVCAHCGAINWRYNPALLTAYRAVLALEANTLTAHDLAAELDVPWAKAANLVKALVRLGILARGTTRPGRLRGARGGFQREYTVTRFGRHHPLTDAGKAVRAVRGAA